MQPTLQDNQLMSKHRILGFKPQLRLEWRGQDGKNETEQPDHSAIPSRHHSGIRFRYTQGLPCVEHLGRFRTVRGLGLACRFVCATWRVGRVRATGRLGRNGKCADQWYSRGPANAGGMNNVLVDRSGVGKRFPQFSLKINQQETCNECRSYDENRSCGDQNSRRQARSRNNGVGAGHRAAVALSPFEPRLLLGRSGR
jgi:hypothetical protein